jgi:hypothetical protein
VSTISRENPLARPFLKRGAIGRDRLLKTRRPALALSERKERPAQIVLRLRPLQQNPLARATASSSANLIVAQRARCADLAVGHLAPDDMGDLGREEIAASLARCFRNATASGGRLRALDVDWCLTSIETRAWDLSSPNRWNCIPQWYRAKFRQQCDRP